MAKHHLLGGTTTLLCTIYHDIGVQGALDAMEKVRAAMRQNAPGNIAGLFFEGPFLNPKYGCALDKIRPVDPAEYTRYLREYRDILKLWMVAPELDGAKTFMDAVTAAAIPRRIQTAWRTLCGAARALPSICATRRGQPFPPAAGKERSRSALMLRACCKRSCSARSSTTKTGSMSGMI